MMAPQQNPNLKWTPFFTLLEKEVKRFWRVLTQTLVVPLVNSALYLLIFGVSLGSSIHVSHELPYIAFLIPGLVMMGVLNNAFQNSSSSIGTSKFHGDLEDLRIVPLSPLQIISAYAIGGMIRGFLVGLVTFAVGEVFYRVTQGSFLPIRHPFALLFFLTVGGLSFSLLGVGVAFRAKTMDQLSAVGGFILLPLLYLGGVFFPLNNLHPLWQMISKINPMLYFINGVRFGILGTADLRWEVSAAVSLTTLLGLGFWGVWTVKRGPYTRW